MIESTPSQEDKACELPQKDWMWLKFQIMQETRVWLFRSFRVNTFFFWRYLKWLRFHWLSGKPWKDNSWLFLFGITDVDIRTTQFVSKNMNSWRWQRRNIGIIISVREAGTFKSWKVVMLLSKQEFTARRICIMHINDNHKLKYRTRFSTCATWQDRLPMSPA